MYIVLIVIRYIHVFVLLWDCFDQLYFECYCTEQ